MQALKYSILLTLCFYTLISPQKCYSQFSNTTPIDQSKILITYMLEFQQDSTNREEIKAEEMLLFIGDSTSLFMSYVTLSLDSLAKRLSREAQQYKWDRKTMMNKYMASMGMPSRFRYRLYKHFKENSLTFGEYVPDNYFVYEESLQCMKWEIHPDEEKVIQNYEVKKATTYYGGRNWVAWFAPEIPISDGPYKFNGLPELIVKVEDTKGHYVFTLTSFETLKDPIPIELVLHDSELKSTWEEYLRAKENFRANIIYHAGDLELAPESQRIAAQNMLKRNNPLELKAD